MNTNAFTFSGRVRSVKFACEGIVLMLKTQPNAWVHLSATVIVIILGLLSRLGATEWCAVVAVAVSVWTAEAINTAFELLCDVASPEFHPVVKKAKDVAAGAVLLSATGATIVGLVIFVPKIFGIVRF